MSDKPKSPPREWLYVGKRLGPDKTYTNIIDPLIDDEKQFVLVEQSALDAALAEVERLKSEFHKTKIIGENAQARKWKQVSEQAEQNFEHARAALAIKNEEIKARDAEIEKWRRFVATIKC